MRESKGGLRMENVVQVHCVKYEEDQIKHMMLMNEEA